MHVLAHQTMPAHGIGEGRIFDKVSALFTDDRAWARPAGR
jgi:hypothetical protein